MTRFSLARLMEAGPGKLQTQCGSSPTCRKGDNAMVAQAHRRLGEEPYYTISQAGMGCTGASAPRLTIHLPPFTRFS